MIVIAALRYLFQALRKIVEAVGPAPMPTTAPMMQSIGTHTGAVVETHDLAGPSQVQRVRAATENLKVGSSRRFCDIKAR